MTTQKSADCSTNGSAPKASPRLPPKAASITNVRRSKLTQIGVLQDRANHGPLRLSYILLASLVVVLYAWFLLPRIKSFGSRRWQDEADTGVVTPRQGGPYAEVSCAPMLLLAIIYVFLTLTTSGRMESRAPVRLLVFECMAVHYLSQCILNLYCLAALLIEGYSHGLRIWGNPIDVSKNGHALGALIWLQYHSRQLQLFDTAFMVLRKKFEGISFLHVYLRVLNLLGWFVACRFVCGGEAFFPALVSSACQAVVYGSYFALSIGWDPSTLAASLSTLSTLISQVQISQYIICAIHSILASLFGNFPPGLAVLHLFSIANGLILYTDFESESWCEEGAVEGAKAPEAKRVTFSFDSSGWLFVYHFGVGAWLSEHLRLEAPEGEVGTAPPGLAFSGSSGGSLIACVLGTGTTPRKVFEHILGELPECRRNPAHMFPAVENALRKFQRPGQFRRITGHIRVLLTRVISRPPFFMGEVADSFPDNEAAIQLLCASCHVPLVAGIMPRRIGDRYYYDGLVWPSRLLVAWRAAPGDHVVRVSASGAFLSDIANIPVPFWWGIRPPCPDVLRGLFWCGYRDTARWFSSEIPTKGSGCSCRRPSGEIGATDGEVEEVLRRRAVRALLQISRSDKLPEVDPVTGQEVQMLIDLAISTAEHQIKMIWRVSTTLIMIAVSYVCMRLQTDS